MGRVSTVGRPAGDRRPAAGRPKRSAGRASAPGWLSLLRFVVLVALVALIGSLFATGSAATYAELDRPPWAPPARVFGPAWTLLYAMIALAGWLAWRPGGFAGKKLAFSLYGLQLLLNAAWTPLFFTLNAYDLALADIVLLWWTILATLLAFAPHSRAAALLFIPYLVWVGYAAALNTAVR